MGDRVPKTTNPSDRWSLSHPLPWDDGMNMKGAFEYEIEGN